LTLNQQPVLAGLAAQAAAQAAAWEPVKVPPARQDSSPPLSRANPAGIREYFLRLWNGLKFAKPPQQSQPAVTATEKEVSRSI
jgi:hypothetical protein